MDKTLDQLLQSAETEIAGCKKQSELEQITAKYLGKKGNLTEILKTLPKLSIPEKKQIGPKINLLKQNILTLIDQKKLQFLADSEDQIDITIPAVKYRLGKLHPITRVIDEIVDIFHRLGFVQVSYPEIEWDYYAFEALNLPSDHPARDEWETFFINAAPSKLGQMVLTPHTSSGQVREMEKGNLPIRMLNIGRCYRRQIDVSHTPMFFQFEGLLVDKNIKISHLKGILEFFVTNIFDQKRQIRLRPYHFQFTEPSFEVDISCGICNGRGCRLCKEGWLELGGAGMVHPRVLEFGKINSKIYTGFAFGWGIERILTLKYKIPDIRILYQNNLEILSEI